MMWLCSLIDIVSYVKVVNFKLNYKKFKLDIKVFGVIDILYFVMNYIMMIIIMIIVSKE